MRAAEMRRIASMIDRVIRAPEDESVLRAVKAEVRELANDFPLYPTPAIAPH
jgi:glycine/serine hydroxymethyltransferase